MPWVEYEDDGKVGNKKPAKKEKPLTTLSATDMQSMLNNIKR